MTPQAFVYLRRPAISELGQSAGFDFFLKNTKADTGADCGPQSAARDRDKDPMLANMRPTGVEDRRNFASTSMRRRPIQWASRMDDVNDTCRSVGAVVHRRLPGSAGVASKKVIIRATAPFRMRPEDVNDCTCVNKSGAMVPVASFASFALGVRSARLERFNGTSAVEINGQPAPGVELRSGHEGNRETGVAVAARLCVDWTGRVIRSGRPARRRPQLYALSIIVVFLCLAALYESLSIRRPSCWRCQLGVIGAVIATAVRGLERDILLPGWQWLTTIV